MLQFVKLQIIGGIMPATYEKRREAVKSFDKSLKRQRENTSFDDAYNIYIKSQALDTDQAYKTNKPDLYINFFGLPEHEFKKNMYIVYETNKKLKVLGSEIKRLRLTQGWSTQKLSELSGMSLGFINQLENGKSTLPKASSLTLLAKIFGIDSQELLYLAGYIEQKPIEDSNWQITIKNQLSNIGIKTNYINEIIDYIETVQIKQERQETKDK